MAIYLDADQHKFQATQECFEELSRLKEGSLFLFVITLEGHPNCIVD